MVKGVKVTFNDQEYTIPPLSVGGWKKTVEARKAIAGLDFNKAMEITSEQLEAIETLVLAAITRNHPDVTVETLDELDIEMLARLCLAVQGQVLPAGEATPSPASPSSPTGEPSTA